MTTQQVRQIMRRTDREQARAFQKWRRYQAEAKTIANLFNDLA